MPVGLSWVERDEVFICRLQPDPPEEVLLVLLLLGR